MRDENAIVRERQLTIRREIDDRGISLKAVAFDSGIPYATIVSYFPGEKNREPATISGAALFALCAGKNNRGPALPLDLLSLLVPTGFAIVQVPEGIDHDEIEKAARDYLSCKGEAHRADSPGGPAIVSIEREALDGKAVRLRAVA